MGSPRVLQRRAGRRAHTASHGSDRCLNARVRLRLDLTAPEKATFLETLDAYRAAAPLGARSRLASSLVVRVALTYLDEQIFSQPFPQDLVGVLDSGKGRGVR